MYEKPEVLIVGTAINVIQGRKQLGMDPGPNGRPQFPIGCEFED